MAGYGNDSMYTSGGGSNFYNPPPTGSYGGSNYIAGGGDDTVLRVGDGQVKWGQDTAPKMN